MTKIPPCQHNKISNPNNDFFGLALLDNIHDWPPPSPGAMISITIRLFHSLNPINSIQIKRSQLWPHLRLNLRNPLLLAAHPHLLLLLHLCLNISHSPTVPAQDLDSAFFSSATQNQPTHRGWRLASYLSCSFPEKSQIPSNTSSFSLENYTLRGSQLFPRSSPKFRDYIWNTIKKHDSSNYL